MEQIHTISQTSSTSILNVLLPTFKIYTPLLLAHKNAILSTPRTEKTYGPHPRQKLDIYSPPPSPSKTVALPILVFFYGGGLSLGDKIVPVPGIEGLVYHNLGAFFAQRGVVTVIPDYRRVNDEEGAVFPSGGEDVSLVLKYVEENLVTQEQNGGGKTEVYLMGNSAGGVHISTFLFSPVFLEQRKRYVSETRKGGLVLRGAVEVQVPMHFQNAAGEDRVGVLEKYYGVKEEVERDCVLGLIKEVLRKGLTREEAGVPRVLALLGEFDPEDEIGEPMRNFVQAWREGWGDEGLQFEVMEGHNHISPPWALMAGEEKGEKWGEDIVKWIKG